MEIVNADLAVLVVRVVDEVTRDLLGQYAIPVTEIAEGVLRNWPHCCEVSRTCAEQGSATFASRTNKACRLQTRHCL
jgi:hypothetical protein